MPGITGRPAKSTTGTGPSRTRGSANSRPGGRQAVCTSAVATSSWVTAPSGSSGSRSTLLSYGACARWPRVSSPRPMDTGSDGSPPSDDLRGTPMRLWWILPAAVLWAGCSGYNGGRVPAIGVVTLDGAPLGNVYVTFRPDDGEPGNGGFAITDADGRFEIQYPDTGKGLVPARYKVTVTPPPQAQGGGPPNVARNAQAKKSATPASYPSIYSSPESTPLRAAVSGDGQPLRVELFSSPPPQKAA